LNCHVAGVDAITLEAKALAMGLHPHLWRSARRVEGLSARMTTRMTKPRLRKTQSGLCVVLAFQIVTDGDVGFAGKITNSSADPVI
jgi:hypothetical protein